MVRQAGEWSSCSNQLVVRCHRADHHRYMWAADHHRCLFSARRSEGVGGEITSKRLYTHFCKTISSLPHGELPRNGEPLAGTVRHISATDVAPANLHRTGVRFRGSDLATAGPTGWRVVIVLESARRSLSSCSNQLVAQKELGEKLPVSDNYLFPPSFSKLYRHLCKDHNSELAARGAPL